jgi:hypothetical protein
MYCSLHRKNRSLHFLEPILGTDQYRCVAGNECQMSVGSGGSNSINPNNNHNSNHQTHFAPVGSDNPNFERRSNNNNNHNHNNNNVSHNNNNNHNSNNNINHINNNIDNNNNNNQQEQFQSPSAQQQSPLEKFMCSEHNKLRISTMLDQFFQNDGTTAYKCKVGEECKTLGQGGSRRTETVSQRYISYPPQNNRSGQQQLSPPFKPGVRPTGYQSQSFDSYPPQQSHHWPTNHHDPYGQSYRPPYNNYPPHYYSNFALGGNNGNGNDNHQSGGERQRQICALHQKLRTIQNLVEMPSGKWECTSADPCRQSAAETTGKDQGQ